MTSLLANPLHRTRRWLVATTAALAAGFALLAPGVAHADTSTTTPAPTTVVAAPAPAPTSTTDSPDAGSWSGVTATPDFAGSWS